MHLQHVPGVAVITVICYSTWCMNPEGEMKISVVTSTCVLWVSCLGMQPSPCQRLLSVHCSDRVPSM